MYLKNINREKGLQKIQRDLLTDYQNIDKIQSKSTNYYQQLKNNNPFLITQQDYLINNQNDINLSDSNRKIFKTMENRSPKKKINLKHIKVHQSDIKKQRKIMAQNILIGNYMNDISEQIKISYLSKKEENEGKENVISLFELIYDNISREPFLYLINDYCDIGPIMKRDDINYNHFHNPLLIKFLYPNLTFSLEDFDNNLIKKNTLNLEIKHKIASKIFKEIFLGLKYIHSLNIVHRDIKIENILFDSKENKTKIIDFSISTILQNKNSKIDEPGGSMHYQAPELQNVENNNNFNPFFSDIWSVGICLFIFIFEEFPFDSDSELELQMKILENEIKLPFNPQNKNFEDLLFKLLEKDPNKRLTDINKIINLDYFNN